MEEKIKDLIKWYEEINEKLVESNPKILHEFDWSGEAYQYSHNQDFISQLKKLL
ncbi:MAG: hypothetical protein PSN34_06395 [Urechidicola sp.]|nr:hypothetical protein [Urechidicola sp.]